MINAGIAFIFGKLKTANFQKIGPKEDA